MSRPPRVEVPSLRSVLGSIACRATTTTTTTAGLAYLEGALTESDRDVMEVVNDVVDTVEIVASGRVDVRLFGALAGSDNVATCAASINAALAFAAANGCPVVYIPAGIYYIDASILIPSNVTLEGAGRQATKLILHATASLGGGIICNANWSLGNTTSDSHVAVRALTLDGASVSPLTGQNRGVFFNKTSYTVIEDCLIVGTLEEAIRINNMIPSMGLPVPSRDNAVRNNIIDRTGLVGDNITISSLTLPGDNINEAQEPSNTFDTIVESNTSIGGYHGIALFNVKGFRVASNNCRDNTQRGIILGPDVTDGAIVANTVLRAGSTGIHGAYRTKRVTVTGNTVYGTVADGSGFGQEGQGIKFYEAFEGLTITGNTCEACATDGIALLGGLPPTTGGDGSGFVVSGNSCIANNRHGIHVRPGTLGSGPAGPPAPIHTGTISGNVCVANISNGIHVSTNDVTTKPENIAITGNATKSNGGWGLFADNLLNSNVGANQHASNTSGAASVTFAGMSDEQISHHNGIARVTFALNYPTAGAWNRGDIVYKTDPAPSGKVGWVCTTSGSPGTWKPFGAIDA